MRTIIAAGLCVVLLGACGSMDPAQDGTTTTTTTTEVPPPDAAGLQCDAGSNIEEMVIDHVMDAGVASVEEALESFVAESSRFADLTVHPDDAVITSGDTRFVDGRGRVVLVVHVEGLPGGWVVSGYTACS